MKETKITKAIKVKSIYKIKEEFENSYSIQGYIIQDSAGNVREISARALKLSIKQGIVEPVNLNLTSNGRLVDIKQKDIGDIKDKYTVVDRSIIGSIDSGSINPSNNLRFKSNIKREQLERIKSKSKILGVRVERINPDIIIVYDRDCVSIISDKQILLHNRPSRHGAGLFKGIKSTEIDLSDVSTIHMTDMSFMFYKCEVERINFGDFRTDNVEKMNNMFEYMRAEELRLEHINTLKVRDMSYMFSSSNIKELYIEGLNTQNVTDMTQMFSYCYTDVIDVSRFTGKSVKLAWGMFKECNAKLISLGNFYIADKDSYVYNMFENYEGVIISNNNQILELYKRRKRWGS